MSLVTCKREFELIIGLSLATCKKESLNWSQSLRRGRQAKKKIDSWRDKQMTSIGWFLWANGFACSDQIVNPDTWNKW